MFLAFLEAFFSIMLTLFVLSQIVIPLFRGTIFFPLLRPERRLEKELTKERQKRVEETIKKAIEKEKNKRRK